MTAATALSPASGPEAADPDAMELISVVSGKGGVGKTMVALAIASELAERAPTVIVDLDFFNRGLTGLLSRQPEQVAVAEVAPPAFVHPDAEASEGWQLMQVRRNLAYVRFGDLEKHELSELEAGDPRDVAGLLQEFLAGVAAAYGARHVVLDCHGGPDTLSFAAVHASRRALLVSEPDKITLYGTLNFVRVLRASLGDQPRALHLVFNKVVPAFSGRFLKRFYDRYLRAEFDGNPLAGVYPLELYLTKEFEKTPFLTKVYPDSELRRKTSLMLYDLGLAPPGGRLARLHRATLGALHRWSLGQRPAILNPEFVLPTIVVIALTLGGITIARDSLADLRLSPGDADLVAAATIYVHARELLQPPDDGRVYEPTFGRPLDVAQVERFVTRALDRLSDTQNPASLIGDQELWSFQTYGVRSYLISLAARTASGGSVPLYYRDDYVGVVEGLADFDPGPELSEAYFAAIDNLIVPEWWRFYLDRLGSFVGEHIEFVAMLGITWYVCTYLVTWANLVHRGFTYAWRARQPVAMGLTALFQFAFWAVPLLIWLILLSELDVVWERRSLFDGGPLLLVVPAAAGLGVMAFAVQLYAGGLVSRRRDVTRTEKLLRAAILIGFGVVLGYGVDTLG